MATRNKTADDVEVADAPEQLTLKATEKIRDLIIGGLLLPGEKIRQVELAKEVGVSRSPLREALRTLESDGIVQYETNRGYVVSRLRSADLEQIYRMRDLLEHELLASVEKPTAAQIADLERINKKLAKAIEDRSVTDMLKANREFHYAIFELSPLALIRRETVRLWQLSEGYRATYLWLPETRSRIVEEHVGIIKALRDFDIDKLIERSVAHRDASQRVVVGLLASR